MKACRACGGEFFAKDLCRRCYMRDYYRRPMGPVCALPVFARRDLSTVHVTLFDLLSRWSTLRSTSADLEERVRVAAHFGLISHRAALPLRSAA